jgi:hypothetical protein
MIPEMTSSTPWCYGKITVGIWSRYGGGLRVAQERGGCRGGQRKRTCQATTSVLPARRDDPSRAAKLAGELGVRLPKAMK